MGITEEARGDLDKTLKELNLSDQEVDKFSKAFKDPEFLKLFEEYAKEVSDPKVKAETDLYLRQLEAEGRGSEVYGKDVTLIIPTEQYVIKTKDKSSGTKVFINMCSSDKLEKLSMESTKGPDGKAGKSVQIPLSLSQKKTGQDKSGKAAWVWDFVVHPHTLDMAQRNPAIKKLVVDTAMEHIDVNNQVSLSRDYKVMSMKYKGTPEAPKPHVLTVRTGGKPDAPSAPGARIAPVATAPAVSGIDGAKTGGAVPNASTAGQLQTQQGGAGGGGKAGARSAFKFPESGTKAKAPAAPTEPHQAGYQHASGEVTPQWELIHRGQVDLTECWGDTGRTLAAAPTSYPTHLVLRLQLPGCSSAATLQLDVGKQMASVVLPTKYRLEVSLPYPVDDTQGKAKFDKTKQQLEVTLPTLPPPKPTPPPQSNSAQLVTELDSNPTTTTPQATNNTSTPQEKSHDTDDNQANDNNRKAEGEQSVLGSQAESASKDIEAVALGTVTKGDDCRPDQGEQLSPGLYKADDNSNVSQSTDAPVGSDGLTENQRRWAELHAQQQQQAAAAAAAAAATQGAADAAPSDAALAEESESVCEFEEADAWCGARPGRVFKLGSQGLGYYRDQPPVKQRVGAVGGGGKAGSQQSAAAAVAAAAPMQLKPRLCSTFADELD